MLTLSGGGVYGTVTVPLCIPFPDQPPPVRQIPHPNPWTDKCWLPAPPDWERPEPKWNLLDYPLWGMSRFAEMNVLLTSDDWAALRAVIGAGNQVTLFFDDGNPGGAGSLPMLVHSAIPVADCRALPTGEPVTLNPADPLVLWHLTLVDYRYQHAAQVITAADIPRTTWGSLLSSLIAPFATVSASTINTLLANAADGAGNYDDPTDVWESEVLLGMSRVAVLDAAAAAVGLRVVYPFDQNAVFQSHVTATAALLTPDPYPMVDLHWGGFRRVKDQRCAQLTVVRYGSDGIEGTATATIPDGQSGQLTAWLPHTNSTSFTRYARDHRNWTEQDAPHMAFAGFPACPTSALIDRYWLDHDAGVSWCLSEGGQYPWPLIGQDLGSSGGGAAGGGDGVVKICITRDAYGAMTGIQYVIKNGATYTCVEADDCCDAPSPPPPPGPPPPPPPPAPPEPPPEGYAVFVRVYDAFAVARLCQEQTPVGIYDVSVSYDPGTGTVTYTYNVPVDGYLFPPIPWGFDATVTLHYTGPDDVTYVVASAGCGGSPITGTGTVAPVDGGSCEVMWVNFAIGDCPATTPVDGPTTIEE